MAKGTRVSGSEFDQTYLDTDSSVEVHRDYGAHFFRWGFTARFLPGKKVLDAGCGGNFMLGRVAIDHGRMQMRPLHYVGVDLSPLPPVRTMHKTVIGDFNFIERRQELIKHFGKFDVVTSFEVIEHMPVELGHQFLAAMRDCLAPGGLILLSTPKNEGAKMAKNHIHEWSGEELKSGIEAAGLRIEKRFGTYADVKQLEKAAKESFPEAAEVLSRLSAYYCNDVLSCFLAPLFPDHSKNNVWQCVHPDPTSIDPGPDKPGDKLAHTWPVAPPSDLGVLNQNTKGLPKGDGPVVDRPVVGRPVVDRPVVDRPVVDRPVAKDEAADPDDDLILDGELVDGEGPAVEAPSVLSINSYAGSLLIGAELAGVPVTASYEDCGFGSEWQAKNFPNLKLVWKREGWPDTSLEDQIVVAHPPCAAFSMQAIGTRTKHGVVHGLENKAFGETIEVIRYSLSHRAQLVAVESVQQALEGGRQVMDSLAEEYGYNLYRVLQNAATFNIPQWRARYWAIFKRRDLGATLAVWHTPKARKVKDILDGIDPGPSEAAQDQRLQTQREILERELGAGAAEHCLSTPGILVRTIRNLYKPEISDMMEISSKYCVGTYERLGSHNPKQRRFMSATIRVLDPEGYANVLVRDTWWVYRGRNVTPAEYRALMGFPRDYILDKDFRSWLSKGVVPHVAAWVLDLMRRNVTRDFPTSGVQWLKPGDTVDFQIDKKMWKDLADGKQIFDPYHLRPVEDPYLFRKPKAVEKLGPDAVVVEDHESVDISPKSQEDVPVKAKREPAAKKKRVEQRYSLMRETSITGAEIEAAFVGKATVIVPPLKSYGLQGYGADVILQYEPPNAGGGRHDTDRIAARGAKKLGAEWSRA